MISVEILRDAIAEDAKEYFLRYGCDPHQVLLMNKQTFDDLVQHINCRSYVMEIPSKQKPLFDGVKIIIDHSGHADSFQIAHIPE